MTTTTFTPVQSSDLFTLMLYQCSTCTRLLAPMITECACCHGTEFTKVASSGLGSLVTFKVVQRESDHSHGELVPHTIAIVELDDGPWMYSWVTGTAPEASGDPIRVRFTSAVTVEQLPVFEILNATTLPHPAPNRPNG